MAGLYSCDLDPAPFVFNAESRVDLSDVEWAAARASIARRVSDLHLRQHLAAHPPPHDAHAFASHPVRPCNDSAVAEYLAFVQSRGPYLADSADAKWLADMAAANSKMHWRQHAIDAVHATIRAFDLAQIPLVLDHGTLLGWYRQCDVLAHTDDMDFYVPAGYIVSAQHYALLQARDGWMDWLID